MTACDWEADLSCCPDWDGYTEEIQVASLAWAMDVLDALTGRQFQQCPVTVRPCGMRCANWGGYITFPVLGDGELSGVGSPWMIPWIDNGVWRNCGCAGSCSCSARCEQRLPSPAATVTEVMVGGLVLDPSAYYLVNQHILVRTDGECWPVCQDMDLPLTDEGTWSVTYSPGSPLPAAGARSLGQLACEYAKSCAGGECALPQQLLTLSRQGVQVEVADPATVAEAGLTGLANVDLWIRSVNPARLAQPGRVLSPDVKRARFV